MHSTCSMCSTFLFGSTQGGTYKKFSLNTATHPPPQSAGKPKSTYHSHAAGLITPTFLQSGQFFERREELNASGGKRGPPEGCAVLLSGTCWFPPEGLNAGAKRLRRLHLPLERASPKSFQRDARPLERSFLVPFTGA